MTPTVNRTLKNAEGIQRYLEANGGANIDRRVHSVDDINKIKEVPSDRLKTIYNFTDGCIPDAAAKQINYKMCIRDSYMSIMDGGTSSTYCARWPREILCLWICLTKQESYRI